ncbi:MULTISPECIES: hypothetical protein [unclassified Rhodanobacter]|uniref:hypothetical protein n=1 Tax=unclassified Rhodanobacter TaxID=2621553 RepID=UPI0007A9ADB6|nr:hypothetical protein [Rhodanobacter sp. FW510-R10]KZC30056.1 hypothetical protein RhoFW510R10_03530 [Rhodanobacter sp. FW510-R10]
MTKTAFAPVRFEATTYRAGTGLLSGRGLSWAWHAEVQGIDATGRKRRLWGRKCLNETHAQRVAEHKLSAFNASHGHS